MNDRLRSRVRLVAAIACLVGAALSLAIGPILVIIDLFQDKSGCSRRAVEQLASPDNIWVAFMQEEICGDGWFQTTYVNIVQLAQQGFQPTRDNDVFATDEIGGVESGPVLQWLSSQKLRITVPNKSLIGLQKASYQGIDISVRFDPDDPVARQQFLKNLEQEPK